MKETALPRRAGFLDDIHRLRGLAILLIVATHCVSFFSWTNHPFARDLAKDLSDNSTVLFMFIAGNVFHHTIGGFRYGDFLKRKFLNVGVPYVLAASPGILYVLLRASEAAFFRLGLAGAGVATKIGFFLLYGGEQINYALWFIPVMSLYYLAAPGFVGIIRKPWLYSVLALLLPLSVLMHRPLYTQGHNLVLALYFLSAYLCGMLCSQYRTQVTAWLDRFGGNLIAATVMAITLHLAVSLHHGKYTADQPFSFQQKAGWVDWLFLQKLLLTHARLRNLLPELLHSQAVSGRQRQLGHANLLFANPDALLFGAIKLSALGDQALQHLFDKLAF
jgi:hypothetical protein